MELSKLTEASYPKREKYDEIEKELKARIAVLSKKIEYHKKANPLHSLPDTKAHLKIAELQRGKNELEHFLYWLDGTFGGNTIAPEEKLPI